MKTVFCDFCGQQLTAAEVKGIVRMPFERGTLTMVLLPCLDYGERMDICWRCLAERLWAVAPHGNPWSADRGVRDDDTRL
jgi:hypothetical protein